MSDTIKKLKADLARLSPDDRAELAYFLVQSLEEQEEVDVKRAWDAELRRRLAEIDGGAVEGIPAEEVFDELRRQYT